MAKPNHYERKERLGPSHGRKLDFGGILGFMVEALALGAHTESMSFKGAWRLGRQGT